MFVTLRVSLSLNAPLSKTIEIKLSADAKNKITIGTDTNNK